MLGRPNIVIAGLACETSTFSPARTLAPAFHARRGKEVIDEYAFLHPGTALGNSADWHGALIGHALPGGIVTREAFEELSSEILTRLKNIKKTTSIDGLWFDIHGAMCVEGMDDSEAELLHRVREVIGPDVIVSASMDLHGNVSRRLAHQTDLITCYRMAPHEDELETKERACRNLVDMLKSPVGRPGRPLKAWVPIPVLLPGEQTSTRIEPAKGLYALVPDVESTEGVLDAAIWVGYAWADEPRNHAVVVVTGWNAERVNAGAKKLANHFWDVRKEFKFVAPTGSLMECIDAALKSTSRPFFISDSGDNPTAGGAGDVTWSLNRILGRPEFKSSGPTVIYASIPGPQAIETILKAGIGAEVTVTAGAEVDNLHDGPITMTGHVHSIRHGDRDAVVEAVLQVGSVFVIITKLRKPYHHEKDFTGLNLAPRNTDIVFVKIGYLEPELFDMAADWLLALTPGGVDQDLPRLGHRRICRPMWPYDREFPQQPDLTPRFIPFSNEAL
ncbi:Microcystin LR degradation protein MlrC C-terminal [Penicillium odoratum]|uniref:Microcystin LR degradation protein MlrC C-terminal n=1 Tax=Penicillium odoratum TaxID=1167516 RepID=UPI0025495D5B|nr:Microcystin LR degradation protein MlrC C-terminal [Penicillium odoratum]KAJ5772582.1 Microcystin LR degradation protein MlrC C-terminal [Penicillium odoratum]